MTTDAPQGLMLMPVLFNVCADQTECAPSKFANYQTGDSQ